MDRAITILIFLIVLVVGSVLILPSYIDWNQYRPQIEAYAEQLTGRDVKIEGDINFVLIPRPALTLANFSIANAEGDPEGDTLRLQRLEVLAALKPLLTGKLQIEDVRLYKPQIALEILAGNRTNWDFDPEDPRVPPVMSDRPWWLDMISNTLSFDHVSIEDGTLTYIDAGAAMKNVVTKVNAELSAAKITGPFEAKGTARMRGVDLAFDWSSGDTSTVRAVPLRFTVILNPSKADITFRGFMQEASMFGPLAGKLSFDADVANDGLNDLFTLINGQRVLKAKGTVAKFLKHDLLVEMDFSSKGRALKAEDLSIGLGGVRAKGAATGTFGRKPDFKVAVEARSLNLDSLLEEPQNAKKDVNISNAASEINKELKGFVVPKNVTGTLDIVIDGIIYRAGVIQNFEVNAVAKDGSLNVMKAVGKLPGQASLNLNGTWSPVEGGTSFDGNLGLTSVNPRALASWLGLDVSGLSADRLSSLSWAGGVRTEKDHLALTDTNLLLDGNNYTFDFVRKLGERDKYEVSIQAEDLNLAAYETLLPESISKASWPIDRPNDDLAFAPEEFDAFVKMDVSSLFWRDEIVKGVQANLTLQDGDVSVEQLEIESFKGAYVKIQGQNRGTWKEPNFEGEAQVKAADLGLFFQGLGLEQAKSFVRLGGEITVSGALSNFGPGLNIKASFDGAGEQPVQIEGKVLFEDGRYGISALSKLSDDAHIEFNLNELAESETGYQLVVKGKSPDLLTLRNAYGLSFLPEQENLGPVAFRGDLGIDDTLSTLEEFTISIGENAISAKGTLEEGAERPKLSGSVIIADADLDLYLPDQNTSDMALTVDDPEDLSAFQAQLLSEESRKRGGLLAWFAQFDSDIQFETGALNNRGFELKSMKANITTEDGIISVSDLTSDAFGGSLTADFSYSAEDLLPEWKGELTLDGVQYISFLKQMFDVSDPPLTGDFDLETNFSALGRSWAVLKSTLNGKGSFSSDQGAFQGFDVRGIGEAINKAHGIDEFQTMVEVSLTKGRSAYSSLTGNFVIDDGRVRTNTEKTSDLEGKLDGSVGSTKEIGNVFLLGEIDLNTEVVNGEALVHAAFDDKAPPARIRFSGPVIDPEVAIDSASLGAHYLDDFAARAEKVAQSEMDKKIDLFKTAIENLSPEEAAQTQGATPQ